MAATGAIVGVAGVAVAGLAYRKKLLSAIVKLSPKTIPYHGTPSEINAVYEHNIKECFGPWDAKLTNDERSAINEYIATQKTINTFLRDGPGSIENASRMKYVIDNIDSALKKGRLSDPCVLHRGVNGPFWRFISGCKEGTVILDCGYVSTTVGERYARETFAKGDSGVVMHISVPKGTVGALISGTTRNAHEAEFLLTKAQKIRIVGRYNDHNGLKHVHAEIVKDRLPIIGRLICSKDDVIIEYKTRLERSNNMKKSDAPKRKDRDTDRFTWNASNASGVMVYDEDGKLMGDLAELAEKCERDNDVK